MKRKSREARNSADTGQHNANVQGHVHKRRAVPPGYLHDLLQARQRMTSMGLRPGPSGRAPLPAQVPSASTFGAPRPGNASNKQVSSHMLPLLFAQRKKYLRRQKLLGTPQQYQQRPGEPVGLLSLPEDVLLRIVCYLRHDEIRPLFEVCHQLADTLRNAIRFHFNYATPFRPIAEEITPGLPRPERYKKRAVTNLAAVMAEISKGGRLAAVIAARGGTVRGSSTPSSSTAPRALNFPSEGSTCTSLSRRYSIDDGDASPAHLMPSPN